MRSVEHETSLFWTRVNRGPACWEWTAGCNAEGRGKMYWGGRQTLAYRISWEIEHGSPPPANLLVCHHCDNPRCVRPSHLFLGTHRDNSQDAVSKGRHVFPPRPFGEAHRAVTVADAVVRRVRERYALGTASPLELATELGVGNGTVSRWLVGKSRKSAGGPTVEHLVRGWGRSGGTR